MIKPKHIQPGDTVGIVAPSSPVTLQQVEGGLKLLEERGYKVKLGEHLWERDGFLAGPDEHRAADLERMFTDPEVKAIVCARGGYGMARTMDFFDMSVVEENPKVFMGFSDVTYLHGAAYQEAELITFYGPMLISWSVDWPQGCKDLWFAAMERPAPLGRIPPDGRANTLTGGRVEGVVLGGCLCLLTYAIGTPFELDPSDALLIIEDVDEPPHRVDAMLEQLKQSGMLAGVEGLVIGNMTRTDERADEHIGFRSAEEIIKDHLGRRDVPAVTGLQFGHVPSPLTLPLGVNAILDADAGTLTYTESATV